MRLGIAIGETWSFFHEVHAHLSEIHQTSLFKPRVMDVPLLEHAEHPVAVYPDSRLRSVAIERGWEIMGHTPTYP